MQQREHTLHGLYIPTDPSLVSGIWRMAAGDRQLATGIWGAGNGRLEVLATAWGGGAQGC